MRSAHSPISYTATGSIFLWFVACLIARHSASADEGRVRVYGPAGIQMHRLETQAMKALNAGKFSDARDLQNELQAIAVGQLEKDDWRLKASRLHAEAFEALANLPEHRQESMRRAVKMFRSGKQHLQFDRFEESCDAFEQAAEIIKDNLGAENFLYTETTGLLGKTLAQAGEYGRARQILQMTVETKKAFWGADHPSSALTLAALGSVEIELGDFDAAEQHLLRVVEIREKEFGGEFVDTVTALQEVAAMYLRKPDLPSAEKFATRAANIAAKTMSKGHSVQILCRWRLAQCSAARSDFESAEKMYGDIVPEFERVSCNVAAPIAAEIIEEYASILSKLSKDAAADRMRNWGQKVREDGVGASLPLARKSGQ